MKMYVLQTLNYDNTQGISSIVWHRHLHLFKEQAFEQAMTIPNTVVIELTQTGCWNQEQMRQEQECNGR